MTSSIQSSPCLGNARGFDARVSTHRDKASSFSPVFAPTFADCFCAQHGIAREQYVEAVFRQVLYRRTRPFTRLLPRLNPDYFTPDHGITRNVAPFTRLCDFAGAVENFRTHPRNRVVLRWRFSLRISTTRLRTLIKETFLRAGISTTPDLSAAGGTRPPI